MLGRRSAGYAVKDLIPAGISWPHYKQSRAAALSVSHQAAWLPHLLGREEDSNDLYHHPLDTIMLLVTG